MIEGGIGLDTIAIPNVSDFVVRPRALTMPASFVPLAHDQDDDLTRSDYRPRLIA